MYFLDVNYITIRLILKRKRQSRGLKMPWFGFPRSRADLRVGPEQLIRVVEPRLKAQTYREGCVTGRPTLYTTQLDPGRKSG